MRQLLKMDLVYYKQITVLSHDNAQECLVNNTCGLLQCHCLEIQSHPDNSPGAISGDFHLLQLLKEFVIGTEFTSKEDFQAAAMTLRTVLLSLQALLAAAEPDDPQDAVVAKQFKENQDMFRQTARHWTFIYAGGPHRNSDFDLKIRRLTDMGIEDHQARVALSSYNWDLERATEQLFS
ncbi:ubiquitin-conjugating enzyme E2-22 kDa isoform X2 [Schistocerca nitens]|uniref:ubiquitin-conjugating enzyme E2-22 kDa isoform X2 n=1 Tax=Schistocerca nitens TaxID=7011 RepID=UPI0021189362|nr:ubiquitin-conjugating enzyme E2-22 kDa isoform X2 [Schistocerca nitens]